MGIHHRTARHHHRRMMRDVDNQHTHTQGYTHNEHAHHDHHAGSTTCPHRHDRRCGCQAAPVVVGYTHTHTHTHTQGYTMITIRNATVETLDSRQARPTGQTILSVTIGGHVFQMFVDEDELIDALASQYTPKVKPCMTPAP